MTETSQWKSPHPLWIVGHRGAPRIARENTLDSFDAAEALGADAIELDLRQSRDGELIVFHDEEIEIGTDRHPVRSLYSGDVRALLLESVFGEYRIPFFDQVLARYGTAMRFVVEVKCGRDTDRARAARRLAGVIDAFSAAPRCLVASFDADFLREVRQHAPGVAVSFLFGEPLDLRNPIFPICDAIGPRADLVGPDLVDAARATGRSIHPWTADTPTEVLRLSALGVDSITANDVAMARAALAPALTGG